MLGLVVSLIVAGCGGGAAPVVAPHAAESCDASLARYRTTLAAATGSCTADAECAIYGGVDPLAVCGGATDVATARALAQLRAERDAAGCGAPGYSCTPIRPHCVAQRCRP